ncbi:MAG TPA: tRNA (N6-isopentenyl adenosine(37)-C2)-methylthiotransferase MiaB [Nitrospirota bacterium]|nr:tRNA (N6-isopentenyl adenosine(37)-C2)-methylthiotransferase MiaB [Nitrospirota bacterium]
MPMKSFHIITFGCQMNEHDSERMTGILEEKGCSSISVADEADLIILNTCSIREKAEQKFYSELGRLRHLKTSNSKLKIAVAGCIAQQEGAQILARAPYVDMIFGPSDIGKLSLLVDQKFLRTAPLIDTAGDPDYHRKQIPTARANPFKAWVSIMYGCDNYCTYCVVPFLRGSERSRRPGDIISEVRDLAKKGVKEVTLLGQNVNSYGKGLEEDIDFPGLLHRVNEINGIERVRFVTSHPRDLSERLMNGFRDIPKVCESLHLPIQSGSDRILSAMNRRYSRDEYLEKIKKLRTLVPNIALTTDIIVGFPGERDEDFALTMQLLKDVQYDGIFAFKYSKRPGTAALKLAGHLPENIKEKRLAQVLSLQKEITIEKNKAQIGAVKEILIEGFSKKGGKLSGRTRENKVVNVAAPSSLIGSLVRAKIASAGFNSLIGQLCE